MKITSGSRRIVFLFEHFVIKIPKFTSWCAMLYGFLENLEERYWYCSDGTVYKPWRPGYLAEIYWADRFGFFMVQERLNPYTQKDHDSPAGQKAYKALEWQVKSLTFAKDMRPDNVGWTKDGRLVFCDYGFFNSTSQCYIGRKVIARKILPPRNNTVLKPIMGDNTGRRKQNWAQYIERE